MIKAVIFDLDNTIYDYDRCDSIAMDALKTYACKRYNLSQEQFYDSYKWAKKRVKRQLGETGASHNRMLYMQCFLEKINKKPLDGALDLYEVYWEAILNNMTTFSYVNGLFDKLQELDIKIAILTDLTTHIQHRKIVKLGIDGYIDALVTSEEVGKEKPSACMFNYVHEKLGVSNDELLMVGDNNEKDIQGAANCGIKGILFTKDNHEKIEQIVLEYINDRNFKEKI